MKKILVTGSTGFIGKNVVPLLNERYDVVAPSRKELELLDAAEVKNYLKQHGFDTIIHLANPTGHNPLDKQDEILERSLRVFMSLFHCAALYGKMIYIGSGAEYAKHRNISMIEEREFGDELPRDSYGISRYIMGELAEKSDNIYDLRLFACCGPYDQPHKLIPYTIDCIKTNKPIELNQNVSFDFLDAADIAPVFVHFIDNAVKHKSYNLCSGKPRFIYDIALEVKSQMKSDMPITLKQTGLGLEYSGDNSRLKEEIPNWNLTPIEEAIRRILEHDNCRF